MLRERKQNTQNREKSWNSRYEKCATLYWYQSCWRLHVTIVARGCHKNHRNCNNVREVVRSTTWKMHHFVLHSKSVLGSPRLWVCEDAAKHKSVKRCARSWNSGYVTCRTFVAFTSFREWLQLWMRQFAMKNDTRRHVSCVTYVRKAQLWLASKICWALGMMVSERDCNKKTQNHKRYARWDSLIIKKGTTILASKVC